MKIIFSLLTVITFCFGQQMRFDRMHSVIQHGGIIRMDTTEKNIYLVFTGHEFADGGMIIHDILAARSIRGSFFFTGDFYRTEKFSPMIKLLKKSGHYLGAHSDKHLLYCSWEKRDSLLIGKKEFTEDVLSNYREMERFGIARPDAPLFMPPYEWYNDTIARWTNALGLQIVNFSPGTSSNADYTTPDMRNYVPSDTIVSRILRYESGRSSGLNGFILLSHIGTDPARTDKFYLKLDGLIQELLKRGYRFSRF